MASIKARDAHERRHIILKLRLRIEAGIGDMLTDVGHADMDIPLPVSIMPVSDAHGLGAIISIDTDALEGTLTAAVAAFERTAQG